MKKITITLSFDKITQAHALKELAEVIMESKKWVLNDTNPQKWEGANTLISVVPEPPQIVLTLDDQLRSMLNKGSFLMAVKHYKDSTGKSLTESKNYVEMIRWKNNLKK